MYSIYISKKRFSEFISKLPLLPPADAYANQETVSAQPNPKLPKFRYNTGSFRMLTCRFYSDFVFAQYPMHHL